MIYNLVFVILWIWFSYGVFGADSGVVSVTEGDSVTLNTDVTEVQINDQILWLYSVKNSEARIAQIYELNIKMFDSYEIFGDRLTMDRQTGSLTIRKCRTTDSGLYKLSIFSKTNSHRSFSVTVYAPLPIPVITRNCSSSSERSSVSTCLVVCSVMNVSHVTLSWFKGNLLSSSISTSDTSTSLSLPLEVEDQKKNIYSCVINNPIKNQTTHLDISALCHTSADVSVPSHVILLISAGVLLLVIAVVGFLIYQKRYKQTTQQGS